MCETGSHGDDPTDEAWAEERAVYYGVSKDSLMRFVDEGFSVALTNSPDTSMYHDQPVLITARDWEWHAEIAAPADLKVVAALTGIPLVDLSIEFDTHIIRGDE